MRNISTAFRKKLYRNERNYLAYADITLSDNTQLHLTNSEIWTGGFSCEQAVSEDNSFTALGSVIIGSATLIINNIYEEYSTYDFNNATVVMRVGLEIDSENIEIIKLGTYRVDDATYNGGTITLSMLDYMEQFDRPYATSLNYPSTLQLILQDACLRCGVTLATTTFPHYTFSVSSPPVKDGITYREVVSWVATIAGCYAKCNENGQLELQWFDVDALDEEGLDGGVFDPDRTGTSSNVPYPSGDVADGGTFNPWNTGYEYDGGTFLETLTLPYIYNLQSQNIAVDDTVITGVSIVVENENNSTTPSTSTQTVNGNTLVIDEQENNTIYTLGSDGYIIQVSDNDFITNSNAVTIIQWLGDVLIGMTFRKLSISQLNDPSLESGDVAKVFDRKGNEYSILITRVTFSVGNYQQIVCGSETPLRNSASRFSSTTKNFLKTKKLLREEQTVRDQLIEGLEQQLSNAEGFYTTIVPQQSGANITYLHNKSNLSDSQLVWKMTESAFGVTNNYNGAHPEQTVWSAGLTVDGNLLINILSAVGIDATWINAGTLQSPIVDGQRNFTLNLTDGTLTMRKGEIHLGYSNGSYAFEVDNNGNIKATSGYIGNWKITSNSIRKEANDGIPNVLLQVPTESAVNILAIGAPWNSTNNNVSWSDAPFRVTKAGKLYATGAEISGRIETTGTGGYGIINNGHFYGGHDSTTIAGYVSFNQYYIPTTSYGTRVGGRAMIALLTANLGVGSYKGVTEDATIELGQSSTKTFLTSLNNPSVSVHTDTDWIYDQYSGQDVLVVTGVSVSVTVSANTGNIKFTKGLMVTA